MPAPRGGDVGLGARWQGDRGWYTNRLAFVFLFLNLPFAFHGCLFFNICIYFLFFSLFLLNLFYCVILGGRRQGGSSDPLPPIHPNLALGWGIGAACAVAHMAGAAGGGHRVAPGVKWRPIVIF